MKLHYLFLLLLLAVWIPVSCTVEEVVQDKMQESSSHPVATRSVATVILPDNVFDYTDIRLETIVRALQTVESENHFMEFFCENFGIPLWNYAIIEEDEYQTCYYVPLYHSQDSLRINSIWFFCLENNQIDYMPIRRGDDELAPSGQSFIFDALSCVIFGESDSKFIYRQCTPATRAWITVTTCWKVYTGPNMNALEYQYTDCTDKTMWIDTVLHWKNRPDSPGGGSIIIAGGGGGGTATSYA